MDKITTKTCSKCGQEKKQEEFYMRDKEKGIYRKDCKSCCVKRVNKYSTENREKVLLSKRNYYYSNRDRILEYRQNNKEIIRLYNRNWREENKGYLREYSRNYRENNKEKTRVWNNNRRSRLKNAEGEITIEVIGEMLKEQNYRCAYCKSDIKNNYTIDHILALSLGGSNNYENIAVSCQSCNSSKGAKTVHDWAKYNNWIGV